MTIIRNYTKFLIIFFQAIFDNNQIHEVLPLTTNAIRLGRSFCSDGMITQPICVALTFAISGRDEFQLNKVNKTEINFFFITLKTSYDLLIFFSDNAATFIVLFSSGSFNTDFVSFFAEY